MREEVLTALRRSCCVCAASKIKCSGEKPACSQCRRKGRTCGYVLSRRCGRPPKASPDSSSSRTSPTALTASLNRATTKPSTSSSLGIFTPPESSTPTASIETSGTLQSPNLSQSEDKVFDDLLWLLSPTSTHGSAMSESETIDWSQVHDVSSQPFPQCTPMFEGVPNVTMADIQSWPDNETPADQVVELPEGSQDWLTGDFDTTMTENDASRPVSRNCGCHIQLLEAMNSSRSVCSTCKEFPALVATPKAKGDYSEILQAAETALQRECLRTDDRSLHLLTFAVMDMMARYVADATMSAVVHNLGIGAGGDGDTTDMVKATIIFVQLTRMRAIVGRLANILDECEQTTSATKLRRRFQSARRSVWSSLHPLIRIGWKCSVDTTALEMELASDCQVTGSW